MRSDQDDILVAAAAIENDSGDILLARRPPSAHQGGLWEFPGGKVEAGESLDEALKRELAEELGIDLVAHSPLIRLRHCYTDRCVVLDVHRVTSYRGEPRGLEGQPLVWAAVNELDSYPMPPADRPIINALRLPDTYVITPPDPGNPERFYSAVSDVLTSGARLIQLRIHRPDLNLPEMAGEVAVMCRSIGAGLVINGNPGLAEALECGVHLNSRQLYEFDARPLPRSSWVGASCHSPQELKRACALGVDFAVLSPVKETASHPNVRGIGWERFADWIEGLALPVYGLGGMGPEDIATAWRHGAQGVAGIRGFWRPT